MSGKTFCAMDIGKPLVPCEMKVMRDRPPELSAVVTFPNGFSRTLIFENGDFVRANATMSGVGTDTDWTLEDGLYRIRVDDQRFEFPETLVAE